MMAEKAIQILSQPELAKSMGEQGKIRAKEAFTVGHILTQYEAFYERVLNEQ
ncbi:MAG: hypothetical protein Q8K75_12960 [Chlamydiales bacterium]|nr:hypothetical protein [Chlamydiales bacterium]